MPFIAAPLLSASNHWPNTLRVDVSVKSKAQSDRKLRWLASSRSCPLTTLSENPSWLVLTKAKRVAILSATGMFTEPRALIKL